MHLLECIEVTQIRPRENNQETKIREIKNGSKVEVIAEKGKMIILPQKKSLEDMMNLVTEENLHSEIKTFEAVGKEEW